MKIIDKYLIKQFLITTLFSLLTFLAIFIVIDVMEHIDEFIDYEVPFHIILKYYVVFLPQMIRYMTPISVLLAALFVTGKMSDQNELTAMKSSGVSLYRYMAPFIATTLIISVLSVYFGGYVAPLSNKIKVSIERDYMDWGTIQSGNNIFFQDSKTRIVTIASYNVHTERANIISIQDFDPKDITHMTNRIDAQKMKYDTTNSSWILSNAVQRTFSDTSLIIQNLDTLVISDLNFTPDEVIKKQLKPEEMTLTELKQLAADQLKTGNNPRRAMIEYHSIIAFAFASLITVLFGLPISSNRRKGGLALQFGINLVITFAYLVFMSISQAFGKNGVMSPVLTAWFANIVFFIAAMINIARAQK
ncbi:Lipopolysaccharide export system permease protein LptG [hydrothermal vent metagenome]|uniref:Lipopolysaccharide export system permease protein LptG n=1 Tax=hydrothermal vent metagenome TaxID=652676 RepID=A0A3B1BAV0_9ZZZZ